MEGADITDDPRLVVVNCRRHWSLPPAASVSHWPTRVGAGRGLCKRLRSPSWPARATRGGQALAGVKRPTGTRTRRTPSMDLLTSLCRAAIASNGNDRPGFAARSRPLTYLMPRAGAREKTWHELPSPRTPPGRTRKVQGRCFSSAVYGAGSKRSSTKCSEVLTLFCSRSDT